MPGNKQETDMRKSKVLDKRAEGKSTHQIADELTKEGTPVSQSTVWRDWKALNKEESLKEAIDELRLANLNNALMATEAESNWLQTKQFGDFGHEVAGKVTAMKMSGQKVYSFLEGDGSGDTGGEKVSEEKKSLIRSLLK